MLEKKNIKPSVVLDPYHSHFLFVLSHKILYGSKQIRNENDINMSFTIPFVNSKGNQITFKDFKLQILALPNQAFFVPKSNPTSKSHVFLIFCPF